MTTPLPKHMAIYSITWALPSELELIFGYPLTDRISEKWRWLRSEFLKKKKKKEEEEEDALLDSAGYLCINTEQIIWIKMW